MFKYLNDDTVLNILLFTYIHIHIYVFNINRRQTKKLDRRDDLWKSRRKKKYCMAVNKNYFKD